MANTEQPLVPTNSTGHGAPIVLQTDSSNFNIGVLLDETNYDLWAPLFEMHVAGRKKMSFLRGTVPAPPTTDPQYDEWFSDDQKVKSWLLSSMIPALMRRYIRLPTAAEIWRALKAAFVDDKHEIRIYTLSQRASHLRQNGRPLSTFFGELMEIFRDLDHYGTVRMTCEADLQLHRTSLERQRVYLFLGGLDDEYETIRGEVLRKDPPLGLAETYAYVRRDAERREAMQGNDSADSVAAFVSRNRGSGDYRSKAGGGSSPSLSSGIEKKDIAARRGRSPLLDSGVQDGKTHTGVCGHCGMIGHPKDRCFELIGYPTWWNKTRDSRQNKSRASLVEETNEPELIADRAATALAATSLTATGIHSLLPSSISNRAWIIDSDATSHMTFDRSIINHLKSSTQTNVVTADGKLTPVLGEGSVSLTNLLHLDNVLVVPDLEYNLLSVPQLTRTLNCLVIFWPHSCVFKDIQSRTTIGYGTRRGKLYYLDPSITSSPEVQRGSYH
ncbi:hypothetical protein Dimus_038954 [Dionaea muscipula]